MVLVERYVWSRCFFVELLLSLVLKREIRDVAVAVVGVWVIARICRDSSGVDEFRIRVFGRKKVRRFIRRMIVIVRV